MRSRQMRREVSVLCLVFVLYMVAIGLIGNLAVLLSDAESMAGGAETGHKIYDYIAMTTYLGTYILMFAAPIGVYFILKSNEKTTDYFFVNRAPRMGVTLLGCMGILAINYVYTIVSEAGSILFSRIGVLADVSELLAIGDDPISNILYFIILVVAPAVLEEFCYRGAICGRLAVHNRTAAVLISAILFSLVHMNFEQIPFAFAAGLLLGYVYLRTGSIWSGVIIHAVNNGFAYFNEYLFYKYDSAMGMQRYFMVSWAAVFVVGLVCLMILALTHKDAEQEQPLPCGQAMAAGTSSAPFIICCSLALAASVLAVPLL